MNPEPVRAEVHALMLQLERDVIHVEHVAQLALQLFDGLAPLHGLDGRDRLLLEAAGCLHDVGHRTAAGDREHHKESARLIREHPWQCLTPLEIEVVAQVARYHRRAGPQSDHPDFAALPPAHRRRVQFLAALLRVADGLDRRHVRYVRAVRPEVLTDRVLLHLETTDYATEEIRAATVKSDLAESVFGRPFELKPVLLPQAQPGSAPPSGST